MTPLSQRLLLVESELAELQKTAQCLSKKVSSMQEEVPYEEEPSVWPIPPSLPVAKPEKMNITPITTMAGGDAPAPSPEPAVKAKDAAGLEMELGRVWFVRLGILLLTTGFVFLSRYTYDHVIHDLGPGIRLAGMYLLSVVLTGAGLACERWRDSLKSYGRIVAAGGLAAIYYCGFAAHHVQALRVIESPITASLLLTLSAALFCAVSLWRQSRVMLSTSLALAFYSISMNPIGWLACFSAIVLAGFGVAMMLRYRWVEVGFVVLIGSYLSFFWWQIAVTQSEHEIGRFFLVAYWMLFTAVALMPHLGMSEKRHALFSSFNHSAFFFLFSFQFETGSWMDYHALFCLLFGAALIALGRFSHSRFPQKSRFIHLAKGLGIFTLGIALHLDGHQLFIAMLIEALVLMALHYKHPHRLKEGGAWLIALLSGLSLLDSHLSAIPSAAFFLGTLAWFAFGILHRLAQPRDLQKLHHGGLAASLIGTLVLALGFMAEWTLSDRVMALVLLGAVASFAALSARVRAFCNDSLLTFVAASLVSSIMLLTQVPIPTLALSSQVIIALLTLLTSLPPAFMSRASSDPDHSHVFHIIAGLFLATSLGFLAHALLQSPLPELAKLPLFLSIPIVGSLAARASGLLAHSLLPFAMHLAVIQIPLFSDGGTLLFTALLITAAHFAFIFKKYHLSDRSFLLLSLFLIGALLWGCWLIHALAHPALPLVLSGMGLLLCARRTAPPLPALLAFCATPFFILGFLAAFYSGLSYEIYLCLIAPLALHLFYSASEERLSYQTLGSISLLLLWAQVSSDGSQLGLPLAAVWAVLGTASLLTGLALKSRCFRLIALIILAFSLGHLMIFDLIKLDPLPRILSFMTLGLGLLGLGFVYNRFQDRLKEIL